VLLLSIDCVARVKLITLPVRERVEIHLEHANATLVEEERLVPLIQGVNQIDFSWANTQVNPDTVVFRVVDNPAIKVLSVSYPPNEQALIWSVSSPQSSPVRVRISYLLGGLDKTYSYRALASKDEKTLQLQHYLELRNHANEGLGDSTLLVGLGKPVSTHIGVGENKRLLLASYDQVPIHKTYTCDKAQFGLINDPLNPNKLRVPMHYVLKNNQANQLGVAALPVGKVRIFQQDGKDSSVFIGEDWGKFTPIDDELTLYLGEARDIVVKRTIERNERQQISGKLYNHNLVIKYQIENFKDKAVRLDVAENIRQLRDELGLYNSRDVEWVLGKHSTLGLPDDKLSQFDRVVFHVDLPARNQQNKAKSKPLVHKLYIQLKNEWDS